MAWSTSTLTLQETLNSVDAHARSLKAQSADLRVRSAAGPINRSDLVLFTRRLAMAITAWGDASALGSAMVDFARIQKRQPAADVIADFNGMATAATALRDWIVTNLQSVGVYGPISSDGELPELTFTTAQTVPLRTNLTAFETTIE